MQKESERFRAWTQHIYQHFAEELGEESANEKPQNLLAHNLDQPDENAKSSALAPQTQDQKLQRRRLTPTAKVQSSSNQTI